MEEKLNNIIFNNLQLLENTPGHAIRANQFVNSQNKPIKSPQPLIDFLDREHLIEQELGVEDKYFLTEFGFNVLDGEQVYVPNLYEDELVELVKQCEESDEGTNDILESQYKTVRNDRRSSMEESNGMQLHKIGIYVFIGFVMFYAGWKFMKLDSTQVKETQTPPSQESDSIGTLGDTL